MTDLYSPLQTLALAMYHGQCVPLRREREEVGWNLVVGNVGLGTRIPYSLSQEHPFTYTKVPLRHAQHGAIRMARSPKQSGGDS